MAFIETTIRTAGEYAYECATISLEIPDEAMELIREFWKSKNDYAQARGMAVNQFGDVAIIEDEECVGGIREMCSVNDRKDVRVVYCDEDED